MTTATHNTVPSRPGTRWVIPQRSWSSRRLRTVASIRFAVGIFLVGVGAVLIAHGHPSVAAVPLAGAVVHFVWGSWQLRLASSAAARAAASGR